MAVGSERQEGTTAEPRSGPGRPRDPTIEARAHEAALSLYAESGMAGVSLEAVSRRAGIGKAALYRRWSSKEDVLIDALSAAAALPEDLGDATTVRDQLVAIARGLMDLYLGEHGMVFARSILEAKSTPEIFQQYMEQIGTKVILGMRGVVRRGIERGELPPRSSPTLILDAITGAVLMHVLVTPPDRQRELEVPERRQHLVEELVDLILAGVHASATDTP